MDYYETELRNKNRGYMKLIVWQKAIQLFELAWKIAFIEVKIDFKLRSQLADAVQSISANISQGYGRRSINEYIQFLYYSLGSLAETMTRAIGLIDKLEQKREDEDWIARIAEDPEEYVATPSLQHSTTPTLRTHA
jgi:four helix bundle protein